MVNIVFIAGGTGGHLFPAIATIIEMQKRGHNTHLITDQRCAKYLTNYPNIAYSNYYSLSFGGGFFSKLAAVFVTIFSIFKILLFYFKFNPKKVVVFGGYTIFVGALVARLLNIELIIHEQNIVLGKANNFFVNYSSKIALTFGATLKIAKKHQNKTYIVGNPSQKDYLPLVRLDNYIKEQKIFTILVIGGSQGASIFAEIMPNIIKALVATNIKIKFKIIQQARKDDIIQISELYKKMAIDYTVKEFYTDITDKYLNSDLIISRAGSGSIMDLIQTSNVGILLPLPSAADQHQLKQAQYLSDKKAAICVEQNQYAEENIITLIQSLLDDVTLMQLYQKNIAKLKINATDNFIDLILR